MPELSEKLQEKGVGDPERCPGQHLPEPLHKIVLLAWVNPLYFVWLVLDTIAICASLYLWGWQR